MRETYNLGEWIGDIVFVVEKHPGGYRAYNEHSKSKWEWAQTKETALGKLIISLAAEETASNEEFLRSLKKRKES